MPEMKIAVPRKLWQCIDCGTLTDEATSHVFHFSHVGRSISTRGRIRHIKATYKPVQRGGEINWERING